MRRWLNPAAKCSASPPQEPYCTDALNGDDGLRLFWLIWILMSTITRGIDGMRWRCSLK